MVEKRKPNGDNKSLKCIFKAGFLEYYFYKVNLEYKIRNPS